MKQLSSFCTDFVPSSSFAMDVLCKKQTIFPTSGVSVKWEWVGPPQSMGDIDKDIDNLFPKNPYNALSR
jgi:hypothetical protein